MLTAVGMNKMAILKVVSLSIQFIIESHKNSFNGQCKVSFLTNNTVLCKTTTHLEKWKFHFRPAENQTKIMLCVQRQKQKKIEMKQKFVGHIC